MADTDIRLAQVALVLLTEPGRRFDG